MHLIELPPRVAPARRQLDIAAVAKPLEAGIAVDLKDAFEVRQMGGGTFRPTIGTVEIDSRRRVSPAPGPVVAGIDPQTVRPRPGSSTGIGGSSATSFRDAQPSSAG